MSTGPLLPRNDILYNSEEDAKSAMLSNVLGLVYGEQGVCKYINRKSETESEVGVVIGIGTGDTNNPVILTTAVNPGYYVGMTAPTDKDKLWIDNRATGSSIKVESVLSQLKPYLQSISSRLEKLEFAFDYGMDCGTTSNEPKIDAIPEKPKSIEELLETDESDISSGLDETGVDGNPSAWVNSLYPNVRRLCIKHDTSANLANYVPRDWELIGCDDLRCVYVGLNGKYLKITGVNDDTGTPIDPNKDNYDRPMKHLDFITEDSNVTMRLAVAADGTVRTYDAAEDDEKVLNAGANAGLVISMLYAGAPNADAMTKGICSHSFVELYNNSKTPINLRGCSLQLGTVGTTWKVLPLKGIVQPNTCFLIRLAQCARITAEECVVHVDKYDLDFPDAVISCAGVKAYLCSTAEACKVANPWTNATGQSLPKEYIDLVGCNKRLNAGESYDGVKLFNVDGYETTPTALIDETKGVFRVNMDDPLANKKTLITRGDTNDNSIDFRAFDYASTAVTDFPEIFYKPHCRADGVVTMFRRMTRISDIRPEMVTVSIGCDQTTRTFNWISSKSGRQYLYYKKMTDTSFTRVESGLDANHKNIKISAADGTTYTSHKVLIHDLTTGSYEYKVGCPGFMSDTYRFEVAEVTPTSTFSFAQVTDQQGWVFSEYDPWKMTLEEVVKSRNGNNTTVFPEGADGVHFLINTGDMTQNGSRPSEWLDYFNAGRNILPNVAQMNVCGNNDLCPSDDGTKQKVQSKSFVYYYNYERSKDNQQLDSNGNLMRSVYSFDYGCTHFITLNSNEWIEDQKNWFIADITKAKKNTAIKWIIVLIHDAPFNITTQISTPGSIPIPGFGTGHRDSLINDASNGDVEKRFAWSRLFEDYGVDLVLSGHKHTYARTKPLLENRSRIEVNGWNGVTDAHLPVDYLNPFTQDPDGGSGTTYTQTTKEVNGKQLKYVMYAMCQASGFKLASNRDTPAQGITWEDKYFPGKGGKASADQKYPTYSTFKVSPNQIEFHAYQVKGISHGGKTFDSYGIGEVGATDLNNIKSVEIDNFILKK